MQKPIREYDGKKLMSKLLPEGFFAGLAAQVKSLDDLSGLAEKEPWLLTHKLVVKPDQLIKRRGKAGLVWLNLDLEGAKKIITENMGREIELEGVTGKLNCFIIEPFLPFTEEYYICMHSLREKDEILFYHEGGVDVGDVDAKAEKLAVPVGTTPSVDELSTKLLKHVPEGAGKLQLALFFSALYKFYVDLSFTYLEINPIVVVEGGKVTPLDLAAKLDLTAAFDCAKLWGDLEFPGPFGRDSTKEEEHIAALDEKTGASLKLTVLNPKGRVWTMVAGGGASVIYSDTICDMGFAHEMANYGEYSGAPTEALTFEYAKTILDLMTRDPVDQPGFEVKPKCLIVGGGIANFTNVATTFGGIIRAMKAYRDKIISHKIGIWVRRGGPNYEEGLKAIREAGANLGIPTHVYGPETHITAVVPMALQHVDPSFTYDNSAAVSDGVVRGPPADVDLETARDCVLFTKTTRSLVYGLQHRAVQNMLDFDYCCKRVQPSVAGMIYPFGGEEVQKFYWGTSEILLPVYKSTDEAIKANPEVSTVVNFASQRSVYPSVKEALSYPQITSISIIAEGVPENKTREIIKEAREKNVQIIGPATVGGIKPGCFRIGNTGGMIDNCIDCKLHRPGSVAYVSRSGGMSNELNNIISQHTNGVYEGVAIGGDRYPGTTFWDHLIRYQANPDVKMMVLLGEVGGIEEYQICEAIKDGRINKPIVAWCIGTCSKYFNHSVSFGHAGSSANSLLETSEAKNAALEEAGAVVPKSFNDLPAAIKETYAALVTKKVVIESVEVVKPTVPMDFKWARDLGLVRKPSAFVSTICDDRKEELIYAGMEIGKVFEDNLGVGGVISLLWFRRKLPAYACKFLEMILILTADHGPCVSGAHNTIVTARAGKDLISSLVSGLLTIGPRFGGAIDGAAQQFSDAVDQGLTPQEFIDKMRDGGKLVMGIGHRIKSLENPDKRVEILKHFVLENFPACPVLKFAMQVEKLTTRKKSNLILNVDGTIGTAFSDLLRYSGMFTPQEASQYVGSGCLNGLFVLGRSIGFIGHFLDQRRLKQGLYRHPADDICYMLPKDVVSCD